MENSNGGSDEYYTPKFIFDALGVDFDLDPCGTLSPHACVPAKEIWTKEDDGLSRDWGGRFVWMNMPFGRRNGVVPWLNTFALNLNGIGLCRAYTSSSWFQRHMPLMDCILFPFGKTKFVREDGTVAKQPGHGIALYAIGEKGFESLEKSNLGMFFDMRNS